MVSRLMRKAMGEMVLLVRGERLTKVYRARSKAPDHSLALFSGLRAICLVTQGLCAEGL